VNIRGLDLEAHALPIAILLEEGGGPDGRLESDIRAEEASVLSSYVAPATLLSPSGTPLARHISSSPFVPGGDEPRIEALHHPLQEDLVEVDPSPGWNVETLGALVEIAGARASAAAEAARSAWNLIPLFQILGAFDLDAVARTSG